MLNILRAKVTGDGIGARVVRGSALTFIGYGASQLLRLASNLILTRLLFPEAFGLMAIVTVIMTGIQMVSDVGLAACVVRSKRGDEPAFLNTAWVVQIIRHVVLAAICVAISGVVADFYGEPILQQLMYGVAVAVFMMGLRSTRLATAQKKILVGRVTLLDLVSQALMIPTMIAVALVWESVWALMAGMMVANLSRTVLSHLIIPGHPNRFEFEREAFLEQFHFGKYLFVSSGVTFVIENGDRLILSKFLSLAYLGFYNIAYFFASVPMMLMARFVNRVIYPLYSARPPWESTANRRAISKTRFALTAGMFALLCGLGVLGQWMIDFLYTPEYHDAGPILVLLALSLMPTLIIQSYPMLLLSVGKSATYTGFQIFRAVLQTGFLLGGLKFYGLLGAIAAQPIATLLIYPVTVWLIRPYKGEDLRHDIVFAALAVLCAVIVLWFNDDVVARMVEISIKGRPTAP